MCLFVLFVVVVVVVVVRLKIIIIIIIGCWVLIHKNNNITDELLIHIVPYRSFCHSRKKSRSNCLACVTRARSHGARLRGGVTVYTSIWRPSHLLLSGVDGKESSRVQKWTNSRRTTYLSRLARPRSMRSSKPWTPRRWSKRSSKEGTILSPSNAEEARTCRST